MKRTLLRALLLAAAGTAYARVAVPWMRRWGATAAESAMPLPGDDIVPAPVFETTKAITIDAPREDVWPWLVQMGRGRGGFYSYDVLDRLFNVMEGESTWEVLPQFQELREGDEIIAGSARWPVRIADVNDALVFGGDDDGVRWTWQMILVPLPDGRTRLISRNRGTLPANAPPFVIAMLDPAAFIMTRKWLFGVKARAERLARTRRR